MLNMFVREAVLPFGIEASPTRTTGPNTGHAYLILDWTGAHTPHDGLMAITRYISFVSLSLYFLRAGTQYQH